MVVKQEGQKYLVKNLDITDKTFQAINFVNRRHGCNSSGTNNQELLRVLIDRVKFLDREVPWDGNKKIIHHLRQALVLHESRHLERLSELEKIEPEHISVGSDGHFKL